MPRNQTSVDSGNHSFDRSDKVGNPLHAQVTRRLLALVRDAYTPGEQFPADRELMAMLGVSQPTVRHAVAALVRKGILERSIGRGGTRVLRTKDTLSVGLIMIGYDTPPKTQVMRAMVAECSRRDLDFNVYFVTEKDSCEGLMLKLHRRPDEERIICNMDTTAECDQVHAALQARGYRHLFFGEAAPEAGAGAVSTNEEKGIALLVEHLVGLGHRNFTVLVSEPLEMEMTQRRLGALHRVIAERRLKDVQFEDCSVVRWQSSFEASERKASELLGRRRRPRAILTLSGAGGMGVLRAAILTGVRVPQDLSLVAFNKVVGWETLCPRPTCLEVPLQKMVARVLDRLWSDASQHRVELVAPHLLEGETCIRASL